MIRILFDLGLGFIIGWLGHLLRPQVRKIATTGWQQLSSYAIGVTLVTIMGAFFYHRLPELPNGRRYILSNFLSAFSVGSGVACGWLMQPDKD